MCRNPEVFETTGKDVYAANVFNSSRDPARNYSWLGNWRKITGKTESSCSFDGCSRRATDGGHLWLKFPVDEYWFIEYEHYYIVPICHRCNINRYLGVCRLKSNVHVLRINVNSDVLTIFKNILNIFLLLLGFKIIQVSQNKFISKVSSQ